MKSQRLAIALSLVNGVLLVLVILNTRHTAGQTVTAAQPAADSILRVRALEVADDRGLLRARLGLKADDIELDMFDKNGRVRVKFGAGEGSGLFLADETGNVGVQIIARLHPTPDQPAPTGIVMKSKGGEQVIRP